MFYTEPILLHITDEYLPQQLDYKRLAEVVGGVLIHLPADVGEIKHLETHIRRFTKVGVPVALCLPCEAGKIFDLAKIVVPLVNWGRNLPICFWWLAVTGDDPQLQDSVAFYWEVLKLARIEDVGLYLTDETFKCLTPDRRKYRHIWIKEVGRDNGSFEGILPRCVRKFALQQYTTKGRLPGYAGWLGLSRLTDVRELDLYFGEDQVGFIR